MAVLLRRLHTEAEGVLTRCHRTHALAIHLRELSKGRVKFDRDGGASGDVDALECEESLEWNTVGAGAGGLEEAEDGIVGVHLAGVGHVDTAKQWTAMAVKKTREGQGSK